MACSCRKPPKVSNGETTSVLCWLKKCTVTGLTEPFSCSFKCTDEDFGILTELPGIIPAPYMARNKWVNIQDPSALGPQQWEHYLKKLMPASSEQAS